jgi:hypothetical protein
MYAGILFQLSITLTLKKTAKIDPDLCFQEQFLIIVNVYCPRADPERADRLRYKLHFYKALDIRANRLRGRSLFPSKLFSFLSNSSVLFLTI